MIGKVRADVDEVLRMEARRREINSVPLEQIEWVKDGKVIEVPKGDIEEWRFVGLSNTAFVEMGLLLPDTHESGGDAVTRDDVLACSPADLRDAVCLHVLRYQPPFVRLAVPAPDADCLTECTDLFDAGGCRLPDVSSDRGAAQEAIRAIGRMGDAARFAFSIALEREAWPGQRGWRGCEDTFRLMEATPVMICRAALLAIVQLQMEAEALMAKEKAA